MFKTPIINNKSKKYIEVREEGFVETFILDFEINIIDKINKNPINDDLKSYGMCDNISQIKDEYDTLASSEKNYFVLLKKIRKSDLEKEKQYKWSAWGGYIGVYPIQEEYFSLEEGLEEVYAYHIMEVINNITFNITLAMNEFSVDGIKTTIQDKIFDGKDINLGTEETPISLEFKNPLNSDVNYERSNLITNFGFNGTALLTPAALFNNEIGINQLQEEQLQQHLLLIDVSKEKEITSKFLEDFLSKNNVDLSEKYIVIFYTGYMENKSNYSNGTPNDIFWENQADRPHLIAEAVEFLNKIDIATTYAIDNVSFEKPGSDKENFPVTSNLINLKEDNSFKALVYHIIITKEDLILMKDNMCKLKVKIELGNVPRGVIRGYSVSVKVK